MKRLSLISISILISFLLSGVFVVPAKAYASDVITLINIELEKNEFFLSEEVNLTLVLNDPLKNNWSPVSGLTGSYFQTQIVYCKTENWNGSTCPAGSKTLSTISEISNRNLNEIKFSGADQFELGEYILWRVLLYEVNSFEDPHDYRRNLSNVFVSGIFRDDILVPDFSLGDFSVVEQVAIPEPEPVAEPAPEPEPTADPVPAPVQQVVVNNPAPRVNTSSPSLAAPQVIQSNFYLPAIAGDINWKPMKRIKGKFDG